MSQPRTQMSSNDDHTNIASCADKMLFQCNLRLSGSTNCFVTTLHTCTTLLTFSNQHTAVICMSIP